jgi:G3E family GTPase
MILDGDLGRDWKAEEPRESRVVFIGRDLNKKAIEEGFLACAA